MPMAWGGCKKSGEYRLFHVNSPSSIIKNNTVYIMLTLCYTKGMKILEQAIRKAIDGGWQPTGINPDHPAAVFSLASEGVDKGYIFTHDFAKALWNTPMHSTTEVNFYTANGLSEWQHHLQQMVISDDPIQYLGEHL